MTKSQKYIEIMEIPFINTTKQRFMESIIKSKLKQEEKCFIVTANPEIVMEARSNSAYKKVLLDADYIVPDGSGILLAAKRKNQPLTERVPGIELMTEMLVLADRIGASCYFLGAKEEVNRIAAENIMKAYPGIRLAGRHHGYFDIDDEDIMGEIIKSKADFVFAALGFPKQELWISRTIDQCSKGIFMGVGGSFDVFSGQTERAPEFWMKCHLEWLYRLLKTSIQNEADAASCKVCVSSSD